jgi:hypothetical protein
MRIITLDDLREYLHNCLDKKGVACECNFKYTKLFCAHHKLDTEAVIDILKAMEVDCDCEVTLPSFVDKYDVYWCYMSDHSLVIDECFNLCMSKNELNSIENRFDDKYVTRHFNKVDTDESDREIQNYLG